MQFAKLSAIARSNFCPSRVPEGALRFVALRGAVYFEEPVTMAPLVNKMDQVNKEKVRGSSVASEEERVWTEAAFPVKGCRSTAGPFAEGPRR